MADQPGADIRADDNPAAADFGANRETHKLLAYPALDWLRFVLASIVALEHEHMPLPGPVTATLAVDVFLALSGWLIGGILVATPPRGLPRFFFNRATRIWLPYLFAVALVYGLALLRDGIDRNWLKYLFYDLTFTHFNFTVFPRAAVEMPLQGTGNHFWSLSIEEQFYLLAPVVMLAVTIGRKWWLWLGLAVAMAALDMRATPIALGVAAAIAQHDHGNWHLTRLVRPILVLATVALFAALWFVDGVAVRAPFAIALVLTLAAVGQRNRLGMFVGAVSYPLYLNHWIGAFVANAIAKRLIALPPGAVIALAYVAAVAAGIAAWALIDRPVMARRAGWFTPQRGRALAALAYALVIAGIVGGLLIRARGG